MHTGSTTAAHTHTQTYLYMQVPAPQCTVGGTAWT